MADERTDDEIVDDVEVFDDEADTTEAEGGGDTAIDYAEEVKRKAEMVDYLKRDIHDERKRRQAAEARIQELEAKRAESDLSSIDKDVEAARAHYRKVFDEGDGEQVAAAQERLTELVTQRTLLKQRQQATPTAPGPQASELAPAASDWIARNKWFKATDGGELSKQAISISLELEQSGYNRNDPALYQELDRRLSAFKPKKAPNAAPVHRGGGRDGGTTTRRVTEADKDTMRMFGYDPNNAKHRENWLKRNDPLE